MAIAEDKRVLLFESVLEERPPPVSVIDKDASEDAAVCIFLLPLEDLRSIESRDPSQAPRCRRTAVRSHTVRRAAVVIAGAGTVGAAVAIAAEAGTDVVGREAENGGPVKTRRNGAKIGKATGIVARSVVKTRTKKNAVTGIGTRTGDGADREATRPRPTRSANDVKRFVVLRGSRFSRNLFLIRDEQKPREGRSERRDDRDTLTRDRRRSKERRSPKRGESAEPGEIAVSR